MRLLLGGVLGDQLLEQRQHVGIGLLLLAADAVEALGKRAGDRVGVAATNANLVLDRRLDLGRLLL